MIVENIYIMIVIYMYIDVIVMYIYAREMLLAGVFISLLKRMIRIIIVLYMYVLQLNYYRSSEKICYLRFSSVC